MKWSFLAISLTCFLLASCSNMSRGIYEGNKSYKESKKSPVERSTTLPTPSYTEYQKEREKLKQTNPAADKEDSPDFNLK